MGDQLFLLLGKEQFQAFSCLNSVLLVLLPKTAEAEAKDYRPIALIHSFAKLLSKLLANRLAPRVPDTIGSHGNQSFRIKGRLILDNYKFVRCAAALFKKKKIPKLLFKLDHIQSSRYFFLAFSSGCFKSKGIQ